MMRSQSSLGTHSISFIEPIHPRSLGIGHYESGAEMHNGFGVGVQGF